MKNEGLTLKELAEQEMIVVDYSDDDIIIIDNIRKLAEPSATRLHKNLLVIVRNGKAQVSLNGRPVTIASNQVLLCPAGTLFSDVMFTPDIDFKAFFLTNSIIQSFLREKIGIWNEVMYVYKMNVIRLDDDVINFFFSFYEALRFCMNVDEARSPYRTEVIQSLLRGALLGLCGSLKNLLPAVQSIELSASDTLFRRFLDLLSDTHIKQHTAESFASELCVSTKYLTAVCRRHSGKTAAQWIREHMLEEVKYYLKNTDLQMKQISDKLGFTNPTFFGKYVRHNLGMTPTQYREKP